MTTLNIERTRKLLKQFDFANLFVEELGWDRHAEQLTIPLDYDTFLLKAVAEKRGFVVFVCAPAAGHDLPVYAVRRKIEREAAKSCHEHLIVYVDNAQTTQVWQWVKREPGRPDACREHTFRKDQPGDALIQKLARLAVSLSEEESISIVEVAGRTRSAFNVEKITKKFYELFKKEHTAFLQFVEGITNIGDQQWYASIMLNRLMFVYFIQKKGFLDNDLNYLQNRLRKMQEQHGSGQFHSFYRLFLLRLFHEGLGKKNSERQPELDQLLGKIPYLNGGLFDVHELEHEYSDIQINDDAFERLFHFFEQYQWHLDERPLRQDNEINPDVLGYIFEKYINQKQMGAYYTKEDITEYIGKNTIIPYLFDAARKKCKIAFEGEQSVWRLLQNEPDRYIYAAVRKGCELELPKEIAQGLTDVAKRTAWNKPAPNEYALPTEIWREVVARRKRYEEVKAKMIAGELRAINDLITYNLNIRQFAQDVIENCEGPELLRAFWHAIVLITILDPTCGSGAFLFAALNILEPLYEACLDRMQSFVTELDRSEDKHHPEKFSDFRKALERVAAHPNQGYFIMKSIILHNLYGVDIMAEAVEICKLRLFLKMVAQVDEVKQVEPLPDIDFNIRCGNTLVGFATYGEVKEAVTKSKGMTLLPGMDAGRMGKIEQKAQDLQQAFDIFRRRQVEGDGSVPHTDKARVRERLADLEAELNKALAGKYGINAEKSKDAYEKWLDSHQPFHWFIEYYGIMASGGFDVIIGNPPYVEYSKVRADYTVQPFYTTLPCGNLYTLVLERCYAIVHKGGWVSLIVPLSLVCTDRTEEVRALVKKFSAWISAYDMRPGSLFEGVAQRLTIIISQKQNNDLDMLFIGGYRRWVVEERPFLIQQTTYSPMPVLERASPFAKFSLPTEHNILAKIMGIPLGQFSNEKNKPIYVHRIVRYFVKALNFIPLFLDAKGERGKSEDYKAFRFEKEHNEQITAILNSTLFYWYWRSHSDGFHCGYNDVYSMPYKKIDNAAFRQSLKSLFAELMRHLQEASEERTIKTKAGKIQYQEFYPSKAKPIIDEIDRVLASHYGFTDEELDFIINYDIKYRMGLGQSGDQEEES